MQYSFLLELEKLTWRWVSLFFNADYSNPYKHFYFQHLHLVPSFCLVNYEYVNKFDIITIAL